MGGSLPVYIVLAPAFMVGAFVASLCPLVIVRILPSSVEPSVIRSCLHDHVMSRCASHYAQLVPTHCYGMSVGTGVDL